MSALEIWFLVGVAAWVAIAIYLGRRLRHERAEFAKVYAERERFIGVLAAIARAPAKEPRAELRRRAREALGLLPYPARMVGGPKHGVELDELQGKRVRFPQVADGVARMVGENDLVFDQRPTVLDHEYVHENAVDGVGDDARCLFRYTGIAPLLPTPRMIPPDGQATTP